MGSFLTGNTDQRGENRESDEDFDEAVRQTAYFLWQQDGKPEGRAYEYWLKARERHIRQRAYDIWLREGSPQGRAEEFWHRATQSDDTADG